MKIGGRFRLDDFKLRFGRSSSQMPVMIGSYGPYSDNINFERTVIISKDQSYGERVRKSLEEGLSTTFNKGFKGIFGRNMEFVVVTYSNESEGEIFDLFNSNADKGSFPIVLLNKTNPFDFESTYFKVKSRFLAEGYPSQIIDYETIDNTDQYKWSVLSILVQVFAKMGGIPWALDRGSLSIQDGRKVLIVGIGFNYDPISKRRGIGYVNIHDENGQWIYSNSDHINLNDNATSEESAKQLASRLINNIKDALNSLPNLHFETNPTLIIHYHGKELSNDEAFLWSEISNVQKGKISGVYVVKINDSNTILFQEDSVCKNRLGAATGYPPVGLYIQMRDFYYLFTTGCFPESTPPRSNVIVGGAPTAIRVSFKKVNEGALVINNIDLLKTVFALTRMNYRLMNNPVMKMPVTVGFTDDITHLTLKIKDQVPSKLSNIPWFL
ncbi:MAG: Piwi domain-containing protein [Thermoplasmatales archaeon]|jgi:argonaute-like protein implicated in RNA metabolism and viral defense|nr:Piwi domain-containing protein [Thermoplasmatales archaeon]